jgi:uncharacterized protein (DUF2235 family)
MAFHPPSRGGAERTGRLNMAEVIIDAYILRGQTKSIPAPDIRTDEEVWDICKRYSEIGWDVSYENRQGLFLITLEDQGEV